MADNTRLIEKFYKNGTLKERYTLVKNKRNGIHEQWYLNGRIKRESHYLNGKLHGLERIWYVNGTIAMECNYENGVQHGLFTLYHADNMRYFEITKVHGNDIGQQYTYWNADGTVQSTGVAGQ